MTVANFVAKPESVPFAKRLAKRLRAAYWAFRAPDLGRSVWIDSQMELHMAEAYYKTLEKHLRKAHRCPHGFIEIADHGE